MQRQAWSRKHAAPPCPMSRPENSRPLVLAPSEETCDIGEMSEYLTQSDWVRRWIATDGRQKRVIQNFRVIPYSPAGLPLPLACVENAATVDRQTSRFLFCAAELRSGKPALAPFRSLANLALERNR